MRFGTGCCIALLLSTAIVVPGAARSAPARPAGRAAPLAYDRFVMPNGLTVLVHTNRRNPSIFVGVYYKVGSKDEPRGRTGFAHLFEHLMFQQTANRAGDYFTPLTLAGATNANGATYADHTEYLQTVPTNAIDLALWLESDRMGYLAEGMTQAVLDEQRAVVKNEKRQNGDPPLAEQRLRSGYYPAGHPYAHDTIGSMADIDAATLATARDWFRTFYGAGNAVLVLSGDIDAATARAKVARYFADVPSGPRLPPQRVAPPAFAAPRRVTFRDRVPGTIVTRIWPIDSTAARDLTLLPTIRQTMLLPGPTSLRAALVDEAKVATGVAIQVDEQQLDSNFTITMALRPGVPVGRAEAALDAALARYIERGPQQARIDAVALATHMALVRSLQDNAAVANMLAGGELRHGDPGFLHRKIAWNEGATSAELRAIAARWLTRPSYQQVAVPGVPEPLDPAAVAAAEPDTLARTPGTAAAVPGRVDRSRMPEPGVFKDDVAFPPITETVLANGLRLVVAERHDVPIIDAIMHVDTGTLADAGYAPGTAERAFELMNAATTRRDAAALASEIEQIGLVTRITPGPRSSDIAWAMLSRQADAGLALAADMVRHPAYPDESVAKSSRNGPTAPLDTIALLEDVVWGKATPATRPLTRGLLAGFHAREIVPNRATLVMMGDITPARARQLAEAHFGDWRAGRPTPIPVPAVAPAMARVILIDIPGAEQSVVTLGQPVSPRDPGRRAAERLMDAVLAGGFDSRINTSLREAKGWTYGFRGGIADAPAGARLYGASGSIEAAHTAAAMAEIRREMADIITTRPITAAELDAQRTAAIHALPQSLDDSGKLMAAMIDARRYGRPYDDAGREGERLAAVTLDQINRVARDTYRPDALTWVVAGDLATIEAGIRTLGLGPVEVRDVAGRRVR